MNITKSLARNIDAIEKMKQQAIKNLLKTLKAIDVERAVRNADLDKAADQINRQLAGLGYVDNGKAQQGPKKAAGATKGTRKGKRTRRTTEDMQKEAKAIVSFIEAGKDEGRTGSDIKKKFPGVIAEGTTILKFVAQYAGEKLKTKGEKAGMKYFSLKG